MSCAFARTYVLMEDGFFLNYRPNRIHAILSATHHCRIGVLTLSCIAGSQDCICMSFGHLFRRSVSTRDAWGHRFEISALHPSELEINEMKQSYDELGEECFVRLNELSGTDPDKRNGNRDLYQLLLQFAPQDDTLQALNTSMHHVPCWVDWEQIARGQDCFYRYGGPCLIGLAYQSLLAGMVT